MPAYTFRFSPSDAEGSAIVVRDAEGAVVASGEIEDLVSISGEAVAVFEADLPLGTYTATATSAAGRQRSAKGVFDVEAEVLSGRLSDASLSATFAGPEAFGPIPSPTPAQPSTIITRWQSGHGWTQLGALVPFVADATRYLFGVQSMKLTTNANTTVYRIEKRGAAPINLTGKSLRLWLYTENPANINLITVRAGSSNMTSFYDSAAASRIPLHEAGRWTPILLPCNSGTFSGVTGTPSWASITDFQIGVQGKTTGAAEVWFGGFDVIDNPTRWPNGVVSLDFDDNYASVWNLAKPELDARGLPGTVYVIRDSVGSDPEYMNLAQLHTLQELGWDIAAHSNAGADHTAKFTMMDPDALDASFFDLKAWMVREGFRGRDYIAYPGGQHNPTVREVTRRYFAAARTTASRPYTQWPPAQPHDFMGFPISNTTTTTVAKALIDDAKAAGIYMPLIFHRFETGTGTATNEIAWKVSQLVEVLDYIIAQGVEVRTVSQIMQTQP